MSVWSGSQEWVGVLFTVVCRTATSGEESVVLSEARKV